MAQNDPWKSFKDAGNCMKSRMNNSLVIRNQTETNEVNELINKCTELSNHLTSLNYNDHGFKEFFCVCLDYILKYHAGAPNEYVLCRSFFVYSSSHLLSFRDFSMTLSIQSVSKILSSDFFRKQFLIL